MKNKTNLKFAKISRKISVLHQMIKLKQYSKRIIKCEQHESRKRFNDWVSWKVF
jgi:hypothetical protein